MKLTDITLKTLIVGESQGGGKREEKAHSTETLKPGGRYGAPEEAPQNSREARCRAGEAGQSGG